MHIIWIIFRNHRTAASSGELARFADKQSTVRESEQDGNDEREREGERGKPKHWNAEKRVSRMRVEIVA